MAEVDDELRPDVIVDDGGNVWTCRWAHWATPQDIGRMLRRGRRIAVRRPGEDAEWLSADDARDLWPRLKGHIEVPGTLAARSDNDGYTYAAHIWRCGPGRLL